MPLKTPTWDLKDEIVRIIRDAIQDGLIRSERIKRFNYKIKNLTGQELEDYLQRLWDQI